MTDLSVTDAPAAKEEAHHGPTDRGFIKVAVALGIITAIEVAWSYMSIWEGATGTKALAEIGGLILMMLLKFVIVAAYFMHLKFDKPVLTFIFYFGFVIASVCFVAVLTMFELWSSGPPGYAP